tara:strand:+ start:861 stop:1721 length:861 start_codon:yes stop_codon:yes gene_type:complete
VDTLPKGELEFKLNTVSRVGKKSGSYRFHDIRPEIEYGVTNKLTLSAEVMYFQHSYNIPEDGPGPMSDTGKFSDGKYSGYELSAKYNVYSVYKDGFGLSLGIGWEDRDRYRLDGANIDQTALVTTIYLQKNFMDDLLSTAVTLKNEFERRKSGAGEDFVLEEEFAIDFAAGVSYRIAPKWNVGVEFRHQSDYLSPLVVGSNGTLIEDDPSLGQSNFDLGNFKIGSQHQNGNYFGPTVHYAEKDWWVTAGVLWQVFGGGSVHADVRDNKNWDEHEKVHYGLSFAYEL